MRTYTESDIAGAIEEVFNGTSAKKAAETWGIPRRTLLDRLHGAQACTEAHID